MNVRRWSAAATVAVCVGLSTLVAAWACTVSADMTLANADSPSWDPNSTGLNYSECGPEQFASSNHCKRSVNVAGTGFLNDGESSVGTVDLYWVDEPYFTFAAGTNGPGQQVAGIVCSTKGVRVASGVAVGNAGSFSATVNVPPTASTTQDGTVRPSNAYYGANAICAVWNHAEGGHLSGFGNQYTIYPA